MTESLRAGKRRRVADDRESVDLELDRAESVLTVPVGGLASGSALADYEPLGGPVARGSVVDALRRQVIRRSGMEVEMDLGNDSDEAPDPWDDTAEKAAKNIVRWLRAKAGGATNYTVAVCDDTIYITKVNGVTEKTALIKQLADHVVEKGIDQSFNLYLCQKYSNSLGSNHAEMCIVAAIGAGSVGDISFLECTAASCDYCAAFLKHYEVPNTSPANDPASQAGWAHPFDSVFWGTQLGDHGAQVKELKAYLKDSDTELKIGRHTLSAPAGRCTHWM